MPTQSPPAYDAYWGYRSIDARRYARRRYGGFVRRLNLRLLERALGRALVDVAPGSLVLDVPCGTGVLSDLLRARGLRVVGADVSPAMLEVAHGADRVLGHVRGDLHAPPFRAGVFDAVLCVRFLMHLSAAERPAVLRTLAALTRGPVIVTVCHPWTYKHAARALRRLVGLPAKRAERITGAALRGEVERAGLRLRRVIHVAPLFSEVWVAVLSAR